MPGTKILIATPLNDFEFRSSKTKSEIPSFMDLRKPHNKTHHRANPYTQRTVKKKEWSFPMSEPNRRP